jgi:hypothetical protein
MATYPIAGFMWGYERCGPLSTMLATPEWLDDVGFCFCSHCIRVGTSAGLDPARVRKGFETLHTFLSPIKQAGTIPNVRDGIAITVLRIFMQYPEMLAWERLYYQSRERLARAMNDTVHRTRPGARFGRHVWQMMSFDPIYRAAYDYAEIAEHHDFIKAVVYHPPGATRMHTWALNALGRGALREVPEPRLVQLLYDVMNYDNEREPGAPASRASGFSTDYVYRETRRAVEAADGKADVLAGIGIDIFGRPESSSPKQIERAVDAAFRAGAQGLLVSREYDEMRLSSLDAVGEAVRRHRRGG